MTERASVDPLTGEVISNPDVNLFSRWLYAQSGGKTDREAGEALWDVAARVKETGKRGSMTITVTVEPMKDAPDVLLVTDQIKTKLPEHSRPASVYYTDRNGNLTRNDPRQPTLEGLTDITTSQLKEIPND